MIIVTTTNVQADNAYMYINRNFYFTMLREKLSYYGFSTVCVFYFRHCRTVIFCAIFWRTVVADTIFHIVIISLLFKNGKVYTIIYIILGIKRFKIIKVYIWLLIRNVLHYGNCDGAFYDRIYSVTISYLHIEGSEEENH